MATLRRVVPAERHESGYDKREPGHHEGDRAFQVVATLQLQLLGFVGPILAMLFFIELFACAF